MTIEDALPSPNCRLLPEQREVGRLNILTFAHCQGEASPSEREVFYYLP